jgi:hypothetical protein
MMDFDDFMLSLMIAAVVIVVVAAFFLVLISIRVQQDSAILLEMIRQSA